MSCNDDKTYEPCSCGCGGNSDCNCDCNECAPVNCIEQAIRDALAALMEELDALVKRAEDAATASEASATASAGSAAEAKGYRDGAQLAATTATKALKTITDVASTLEDTANKLKDIADQLNTALAGIAVSTWYYTTVEENQTVITIPDDKNAMSVQAIYIEGARQEPGANRNFVHDKAAKTITLGTPVPKGIELVIILGTYSDNPVDFSNILASNNGASLVGTTSGQTVQASLDEITDNIGSLDTSLRADLAKPTGSGLVAFQLRMAGTMLTTLQERMSSSVLIDDWIPSDVDPAVDDCAPYIQKAFIEAFKAKVSLLAVSGKTYTVGSTIIIPQNKDNTFLDPRTLGFYGAGCCFRLLKDMSLFESGYVDANGNAVSNFGADLDTNMSMRLYLGGFTAVSKDKVTYHNNYLIRIQDWHHSSYIHDIYCHIAKNGLHSRNNYYISMDNVALEYSGPDGYQGVRFRFDAGHNLCKFSRLIATNANVCYSFEEALTAVEIQGLSMEGCNKGIDFVSDVYGVNIHGCYSEHVDLVSIAFNREIYGCTLTGNYFNFANSPNMYGIYYENRASTNLYIDISNTFANMTSEGKIFLSKSETHGVGVVIERPATRTSDVLSLLPDDSYGKYVEVRQIVDLGNSARANKTNGYITGNYAGKFTEGLAAKVGFNTFNPGDGSIILQTAIAHNLSELVYVCLNVTLADGVEVVRGFVMGGEFYRFTPTATGASDVITLHATTGANSLSLLLKFLNRTITNITGEIRLL